MRQLTTLLLLMAPWGCATSGPIQGSETESGSHLVLEDGDEIEGFFRVASVHVKRDATVKVTEDLVIVSDGHVFIEGNLIAADAAERPGRLDAPNLEIYARGDMTVIGLIRGGAGFGYSGRDLEETVGMPGGRGSDVIVHSPAYLSVGVIASGPGGDSGGGAYGGPGGDLIVRVDSPLVNWDEGWYGFGKDELDELRKREFTFYGKGHSNAFLGSRGGRAGHGTPSSRNGGDGGDGGQIDMGHFDERGRAPWNRDK